MKKYDKVALFVEGAKNIFEAKTAVAMLRNKLENVVCLIDSFNAEKNADTIFDIADKIPIYSSIEQVKNQVDTLVLCMVLPDGKLPAAWLEQIILSLKNNIDVINPLHINFTSISEITNALQGISINSSSQETCFNGTTAKIYNLRTVPDDLELFNYSVLNIKAKRVLTVGSDCNIGKMLTCIELNKEAKNRGINSDYIATGQISLLLKGTGMPIDRVISDFVPGAVEKLILEEKDRDLLFIEGQGSIFQPIYSAVSMGLLHGSAPNAMIFCHLPSRKKIRYSNLCFPDLKTMIRMHEELASIVLKSNVKGVCLNCHDMSIEEARVLVKETENYLGLPCTDAVKFGVKNILDNL